MIVSVHHRFVFLAIAKCASTAIEEALRPYASLHFAAPSPLKHMTLADYENHVVPLLAAKRVDPEKIDIFAVFREPADWLQSWWRYRSRPELGEVGHLEHQNYTGEISFVEFVEEYLKPMPAIFARVGSESRYLVGKNGRIGQTQLYRYDEIDILVERMSERVGTQLSLRAANSSPPREASLPDALVAKLRAKRPRDYRVWEAIAAGRTG